MFIPLPFVALCVALGSGDFKTLCQVAKTCRHLPVYVVVPRRLRRRKVSHATHTLTHITCLATCLQRDESRPFQSLRRHGARRERWREGWCVSPFSFCSLELDVLPSHLSFVLVESFPSPQTQPSCSSRTLAPSIFSCSVEASRLVPNFENAITDDGEHILGNHLAPL